MPKTKIRLDLASILLIHFIDILGFSFVIPFLVVLVTDFGGNALIYGLVGAAYPFFQFIGSPLLGKWSDRYGRKPLLFISQLGTMISWVIFLASLYTPITTIAEINSSLLGTFKITWPLLILIFARSMDGLTGGNISITQAYIADISNDKNKTRLYGQLAIAQNLGFVVGPALAGLLLNTSLEFKLPVLVAIGLSAIATIAIGLFLPESHKKQTFKASTSLRATLKYPGIRFLMILYFVIFLSFNIFYSAFPVHSTTTLGWTASQMGIYFSIMSALLVFVQGPVLSRLSKKVPEIPLVISGSILMVAAFWVLSFATNTSTYITLVLFAAGNGIMWSSFLSYLSKASPKDKQGAVQGLGGSASSLASIIGLIVGGFLYDKNGSSTFIIAAVIMLGVTLLATSLNKLDSSS